MGKNRRKYVRVNLGTSTALSLLDPSRISDRVLDVTLIDLSAGGAQIVATESILNGQPIRLAIRSTEPPIELNVIGRIVRADMKAPDGTFRCAIHFSTMSDADRVTVTRFVLRAARTTGQGADRIVRDHSLPEPTGVV